MSSTTFIGDIHGCSEEFLELLQKLGPASGDQLVLLGDLVNKGPDPEGVIEIYKTLDCVCLLGNHEADHLKWTRTNATPKPDTIRTRRAMLPATYDEFLVLAAGMPLLYEDEYAIAVHGGLEQGVALNRQPRHILTGEATLPPSWKDHLAFDRPVVAGHKRYSADQSKPCIIERRFYGIDTGCVYGGSLTAVTLPEGRITQVRARRDYAER